MRTIDTMRVPAANGAMTRGPKTAWRPRHAVVRAVRALVARFSASAERWRQRRDLESLTDEQLRDIGVTPEDARREAARPFWD